MTIYILLGSKFWTVQPTTSRFWDTGLAKIQKKKKNKKNKKQKTNKQKNKTKTKQKCTEWSQNEAEHITIKSTLYILSTYPWSSNFDPFHSTTSGFRDTGLSKKVQGITSCWSWNIGSQRYTLTTCPEAQTLVRFTLSPTIPKSEKSEMHRLEWYQNDFEYSRKYLVYIKH